MAGIGEIGVRVTADTADFAAGMSRTEQIAATSMRRVEQAQKIAQAASDKFVASLKYQADTFGKTDIQILRYKADLLGASDAAKPLIEQMEAMAKAAGYSAGSLRANGAEARAAGRHAEEFGFKTAGAKRELIVLAHEMSQGNFTRFGGSMLVLAERTNFATLLFHPLTLGVLASGAALALLGEQVYEGRKEWNALGDAIKSTGDYTGYTQHQLDQMSVYFARNTKEIADGREALTALIATGRFSGDQLSQVGRAALDMASDTGKSIEDVAKELAKLPDGARKWAEEYQKTHHVFTAANIELIDSLEKQGKQAAATAAVLDALDESHKRITNAMQQGQGTWDRFWNDWADGLARIKKGLRDLGAPESTFDQINDALKRRDDLLKALAVNQARLDGSGGKDQHLKEQVANINAAIAANLSLIGTLRKRADTEREAAGANAVAGASGDQKILTNKYLEGGAKSDRQKYQDQVDAENKAFKETIANLKENTADYEAVVRHHKENLAQLQKDYAKKTAPKEYQDDAATKYIQTLKDQDAQIKAQLGTTNNLTQAQKEQAEFEEKILDFKGKKLTKEQASLVANQEAIRDQLRKNVADAEELRVKNEIAKLDERAAQINAQMASNRESRSEGYARQLDAFGLGKEAQSKVAALNAITKEYQHYQDQLAKNTPKDQLGSKKFLDEQAAIRAGLAQSLGDFDAYYAQLKKEQGDWRNGATQALQDYLDSTANVAGQVESLFTNAFKGAEDAFLKFVTTGKLSFHDLGMSILADIARIELRKAEAGIVSYALDIGASMFGGSFGPGTIGDLSGARANGGPVTGGSSYLVGERGPEIFTPAGNGSITPNHQLGGGGGIQINTTIQLSESGASSSTSGDGVVGRQLADMVNNRIKDVLMRESRQGGILWRAKMGMGING